MQPDTGAASAGVQYPDGFDRAESAAGLFHPERAEGNTKAATPSAARGRAELPEQVRSHDRVHETARQQTGERETSQPAGKQSIRSISLNLLYEQNFRTTLITDLSFRTGGDQRT